MLGPAVQFREFKLPLGTHWKDNKHFYKGIFLLDWSGEQINNSEKRQIVRQEVEVIVLNLLCECLRTSNWLCSFSQSWWDQILSQVVILELFIWGMRWVELITDQLFCGGCGHFYVCVLDLKKKDIIILVSVKNKGFHSRGWNNKHFGSVNLFKWL